MAPEGRLIILLPMFNSPFKEITVNGFPSGWRSLEKTYDDVGVSSFVVTESSLASGMPLGVAVGEFVINVSSAWPVMALSLRSSSRFIPISMYPSKTTYLDVSSRRICRVDGVSSLQ